MIFQSKHFLNLVLLYFFCAESIFINAQTKVYNEKVIVIGAGVSGLAACSQLIKKGFKNVILIEANSRLGGRLYTIPYGDKYIEIGGQWIHGQVGNPVFNIMKSLGQIDPSKTFSDTATVYYANQNGVEYDENLVDNIINPLQDAFDDITEVLANAESTYKNIGQALEVVFKNILNDLDLPDNATTRAIFRGKLNDEKVDYAVDSFNDISTKGFDEYIDFKGEGHTNLKNGYIRLIEYLSKNISKANIRFNEEVLNINYKNKNVVVTTQNTKTKVKKTYTASIVLSTTSLGYLKRNHKTLFTPSLSQDKINAINRIGFGTVDKVFIEFEENVFDNGEAGLQLFWDNDMTFLDAKYNLKGNKFYKAFNSFYNFQKYPKVLFAFLVGSDANYAENIPDNVFLNITYDILRTSFPKLDFPRPVRIIRSKWNNDPYARGSYSYFKLGATDEDFEALAMPLKGRVFFAGEATSPKYLSTVHGAYISGMEAVKDIIAALEDE